MKRLFQIFIFLATCEIAASLYTIRILKSSPADFKNFYQSVSASPTTELVTHPNFSYVRSDSAANNYGFADPKPYPYQRNPGEYVIGIFGGSVAEIATFNLASTNFLDKIKNSVSFLRKRKLVVLNFALPCGKQPMQFSIFSRFVNDVDLSINLEGFNEVEFNVPGGDVSYPCNTESLYLNTLKSQKYLVLMEGVKSIETGLLHGGLESNILSRSSAYYLAVKTTQKYLAGLKHYLGQKLNETINPKLAYDVDDKRDLYTLGAKNWAKYAKLQNAVGLAEKKKMLFFLQPNLNDRGSKPLSQEEIELGEADRSEKKWFEKSPQISRGYDELRTQQKELSIKTPDTFYDLTQIFKAYPETLYTDSCCHFGTKGNEILLDRMAAVIIKKLNKPD